MLGLIGWAGRLECRAWVTDIVLGVSLHPLRRAGQADLENLVVLAKEYCDADGHLFDEQLVRSGFGPLLDTDDHGVVWMLDNRVGRCVGYAVVTWSWSIESGGREGLLDEIYVSERDAGIGSSAVEAILADCRDRGLPRLFLETETANDGARRLYLRHGFAVEDSIWMTRDL